MADPVSSELTFWSLTGSVAAGVAGASALIQWLAGLWQQRILANERARVEQRIAEMQASNERHIAQVQAANEQALQGMQSNHETAMRRLDHALSHESRVTLARFEKEFAVYQELWAAVIEIAGVVMDMRSIISIAPNFQDEQKQKEYEQEKRRGLLEAYYKAQEKLGAAFQAQRPFMAASVYTVAMELVQAINREAVEYRLHGSDPTRWPRYYEQAETNRTSIIALADRLCEVIRGRLGEWAEVGEQEPTRTAVVEATKV